jgi:hypothetical protein
LVSYVSENSKSKVGNALRTKDEWKVKKKKKKIYDKHTGEAIFLDEYEVINTGTDDQSFSALPAGYASKDGGFDKIKEKALFCGAVSYSLHDYKAICIGALNGAL